MLPLSPTGVTTPAIPMSPLFRLGLCCAVSVVWAVAFYVYVIPSTWQGRGLSPGLASEPSPLSQARLLRLNVLATAAPDAAPADGLFENELSGPFAAFNLEQQLEGSASLAKQWKQEAQTAEQRAKQQAATHEQAIQQAKKAHLLTQGQLQQQTQQTQQAQQQGQINQQAAAASNPAQFGAGMPSMMAPPVATNYGKTFARSAGNGSTVFCMSTIPRLYKGRTLDYLHPTLESYARQLDRDVNGDIIDSAAIMIMNHRPGTHVIFEKARKTFAHVKQFLFRDSTSTWKDPSNFEPDNNNNPSGTPGGEVRQQTADLVHQIEQCATVAPYVVLIEDDFLACPFAVARVKQAASMARQCRPKNDWLTLMMSFGMQGIMLQSRQIPDLLR